ncbi:glycosyltransferase family 4 protein [Rubritalea spongiae]|uniref:Glycosyltransferase family 4 protein n=1 Tax=Rubritalea spongiae TaxID=430797 RepID=A0ABW5E3T8_9BACT
MNTPCNTTIQLILGNSNKRFSGVTSTMLQVLPHQQKHMDLAVMGSHHLPAETPCISFQQAIQLCKSTLPDGRKRVFHARRNDEMIQAIILKKIYKAQIIPVFTSTAQRHHSRLTKWLMKQMDGIITTCTAASAYLEKPADIIVPHGIDLKTYFPAEDKKQAWAELGFPGEYGIGIFGRVRHQKGLDVLIDAIIPLLKENPAPTIVIVGETTPNHQEFLDEQLSKLKSAGLEDRVIVHGKRPFSEIPKLFRAMSLVAALSRNEGYGLTSPEAMASGTAVLTSEAGAWKDVVRNEIDGLVVPCGNVEATRHALNQLLVDPNNLLEMGRNGHQRIHEKYTIEQEAEALCNYFKKLQSIHQSKHL